MARGKTEDRATRTERGQALLISRAVDSCSLRRTKDSRDEEQSADARSCFGACGRVDDAHTGALARAPRSLSQLCPPLHASSPALSVRVCVLAVPVDSPAPVQCPLRVLSHLRRPGPRPRRKDAHAQSGTVAKGQFEGCIVYEGSGTQASPYFCTRRSLGPIDWGPSPSKCAPCAYCRSPTVRFLRV